MASVSWLTYLLACVLVSVLMATLAMLVARVLLRPNFDPERFERSAAMLEAVEAGQGRVWARLDGRLLSISGGTGRAPTHFILEHPTEAATIRMFVKTKKRWREALARCSEGASTQQRFAACFEFERELARPSPELQAGLLELVESDPCMRALQCTANPEFIALRINAKPVHDASLAAALALMPKLAQLPEQLRSHDWTPKSTSGGWIMLVGASFWALVISCAANYGAASFESIDAEVVARDDSRHNRESTSLIVRLDDGSERSLWVPSSIYEGCSPGQRVQREPFVPKVACEGRDSWHLLFVIQLPTLLMFWAGMGMGMGLLLDVWAEAARVREQFEREAELG